MSGLSFSGYVSEHLFLWGNALLHSPDRGRTMEYLLDYDSEAEILLFLVGQDASFAFLNSANEIWYGYISTRIYMKKLRPSVGWDAAYLSGQQIYPTATATTISLFYDSWGMLYELVAFDNSSGAQIERRHINTGAILAYNSYVEGKREMENIEIGLNDEHGDGSVHYQTQSVTPLVECQCPYESIVYDIEQVFHYERTESYFLGAPQLRDSTGGHWNTSLVVYQAIVHFLLSERTAHHTLQKNELAQASHSPFRWWHEDTKAFSAFHEYLFRNNQIESGIHIDPGSYFLYRPDHSCSRPVLPHTVFLDKHDMFRFDVYLRVGLLDINMDLDDLRISLEVSDENILAVETQRWMYPLNSTIRYEVILVDQGALVHQSGPGSSLYPTSVLLQVWHSSSSCFTPDQITSEPEGIHSMDVMLGCPPGRKLVFDLKLSIENLNEQFIYDCPIKTEGRPCLHYHHDFRPLFKLVDFTTGEATLFTGMYTLVVLGGSYISADDITIFSPEKQEKYNNFNKQGQRIWKPIEKESISAGNESTPVYSHTHNGVTWICEQHSPCADVPMLNFPYSPEYYFLIEMSTLGVDTESTYCHYSLQFVVHVHGMDISGNKALVIVAWSFFASVLMVAIFIICNYDNKKLWRRIRSTCQTTDPRVKVVPVASDSSEEVELEVHYREGLNYHPADPSTTSTVIETLLTNDEDYPELPKSGKLMSTC
ncbi:cation channel sperm-associated protein subunit gamma 1-like [Diadema setosum]|uniref:cation channel sperm-associated protein subunit gamma 1-like n=1 Tax=Diadema setosum TaxID=31175 RepID=UPI003B3AC89D